MHPAGPWSFPPPHPPTAARRAVAPLPHSTLDRRSPSSSHPLQSALLLPLHCSERYYDDYYEYRHVVLPQDIAKRLPKDKLLSEPEWRALGVQQSRGWGELLCGMSEEGTQVVCHGCDGRMKECAGTFWLLAGSHPACPGTTATVHYAKHRPEPHM